MTELGVFEKRIVRHAELASERLGQATRSIMADFAKRGLVQSGARIKREAELRNEQLASLTDWCLSELAEHTEPDSHLRSIGVAFVRARLEDFMMSTRAVLLTRVPDGAAQTAAGAILDKADRHARAEVEEFGAGFWRSSSSKESRMVTTNNVTMFGSQIGSLQQAGAGAAQQNSGSFDVSAFRSALDSFDEAVIKSNLDEQERAALRAEIETMRPQLSKPQPNPVVITEGLKTLRNIVEGIAAGLLTPAFVQLAATAAPLVASLGG